MPAKGGKKKREVIPVKAEKRKPKGDKLLDIFYNEAGNVGLKSLIDNLTNLVLSPTSARELQDYVQSGSRMTRYKKAVDAMEELLPRNFSRLSNEQKDIALDYLLLNFGIPIYKGKELTNSLELKMSQLSNIIFVGQILKPKFPDLLKEIAPTLKSTSQIMAVTADRERLNAFENLTTKENYSGIEASIIDLSRPSLIERHLKEIKKGLDDYNKVLDSLSPEATSKQIAEAIFKTKITSGLTLSGEEVEFETIRQKEARRDPLMRETSFESETESISSRHTTLEEPGNPDYTKPTLGASVPAHSSQNPSSASAAFQTGDNKPSTDIPKATPETNREYAAGLSVGMDAALRVEEANLMTAAQVARQNLLLKSNMISAKQQKPQKAFKKKELTFEEWMKIIETRELEALKLNVDQMNVMQLNEVMQEKQRNIDRQINSNLTWGIPLVKN